MNKKILFLTTSHHYDDDRIFYHLAKELVGKGFTVKICSLCSDFQGETDGITIEACTIIDKSIEEKRRFLEEICQNFHPHTIICSEPLAVVAASNYKKKSKVNIVYDITEWYPSNSMLSKHNFLLRPFYTLFYTLIQIYAGFLSDRFIFGEKTKRFPLSYLFCYKKQIILPYYPSKNYTHESFVPLQKDKICLAYTGQLSKEKGIGNFFRVLNELHKVRPELQVSALIIGKPISNEDEVYFKKLIKSSSVKDIKISEPVDFRNFTQSFSEAHLCFDLRELNFENHHSLPIKLFYYMSSAKPVIYSRLKAINGHLNISDFGYLVDPEDSYEICKHIIGYLENPELYQKHALNARRHFEKRCNWEAISQDFVDFIKMSR